MQTDNLQHQINLLHLMEFWYKKNKHNNMNTKEIKEIKYYKKKNNQPQQNKNKMKQKSWKENNTETVHNEANN